MIAICPQCSSQFNLSPEQVGLNGREVGCSMCGHRWRVNLPPAVRQRLQEEWGIEEENPVHYGNPPPQVNQLNQPNPFIAQQPTPRRRATDRVLGPPPLPAPPLPGGQMAAPVVPNAVIPTWDEPNPTNPYQVESQTQTANLANLANPSMPASTMTAPPLPPPPIPPLPPAPDPSAVRPQAPPPVESMIDSPQAAPQQTDFPSPALPPPSQPPLTNASSFQLAGTTPQAATVFAGTQAQNDEDFIKGIGQEQPVTNNPLQDMTQPIGIAQPQPPAPAVQAMATPVAPSPQITQPMGIITNPAPPLSPTIATNLENNMTSFNPLSSSPQLKARNDSDDIDIDFGDSPEDIFGRASPIQEEIPIAMRRRPILAWAMLAILLIVFVVTVIHQREQIINRYPPLANLYGKLGFNVAIMTYGINFGEAVPSFVMSSNEPRRLVIKGTIQNTRDKLISIPELKGELFNSRNESLMIWTFKPDNTNLLPGERVDYATEIKDPPRGVTRVNVSLPTARDGEDLSPKTDTPTTKPKS